MDLKVFSDQTFFLASLRNTDSSIYDKIKPRILGNPLDNPVNARLNTAAFILRRRPKMSVSRLIGRGRGLIVSSVGYVDLPDSAARILRMGKYPMDMYDLYLKANRWPKGAARVSALYYKDSAVSGFVARRIFNNNDFSMSEITQTRIDAEWRAQKNASANPDLINGSSEEFEEYNQDGRRQCINF